MNGISPWAAAAGDAFADEDLACIYTTETRGFTFKIFSTADSLWIMAEWDNGGRIVFRPAYAPDGELTVRQHRTVKDGIDISLGFVVGEFNVAVRWPDGGDFPLLRYTTTLRPRTELLIPFWPRDIVIPGKNGNPENTAGQVHVSQVGSRSGLLYFSMTRPKAGSLLYLQNLTALADYCQQTETSCANTVGGQWPEMGFALPPTIKQKPLAADKEITISDAIVVFDQRVPDDEPSTTRQFLDMLATAYLQLPTPETTFHNWLEVLDKGLKDLTESPGCWSQVKGKAYFNAYVCDYDTPPEIMVQLAVMLPLVDYCDWNGCDLPVVNKIRENLPEFYDRKLHTIMRWLPAAKDKLEGEEEQKNPNVMDSWYLHHPLLNLSRLALKGDKVAKQLFTDSVGYAMKVAHHFKYRWPVFYQMETLEVIKAETQPGKGGEKDVAGLYAHVMLQAYELTDEDKYLAEAERAAKSLMGLGFELFYQANNTAFAAGALLRLYKITKNEDYLDLSYLCLANVFRNTRLWDCNYGYGKNFPSFFTLFPLNDAPYSAVYEEQEVFCALHDYLYHAEGADISRSVRMLCAEYLKYLVNRAVYYYPPMLPGDMLEEKPKIGELDQNLWIAVEDLHDGWEKCGSVGQEVYGAGNAFGILPRHYFKTHDDDIMIFSDYPAGNFSSKNKKASFNLKGDNRLQCRVALIVRNGKKLPQVNIIAGGKKVAARRKKGRIECFVSGNEKVEISW
ncbi:MAG TPA: hypothetical protein VHB54_15880 [Mucilaginibacter sp.]|nr:hypothetical protein [Mucilaginibacter sp.]